MLIKTEISVLAHNFKGKHEASVFSIKVYGLLDQAIKLFIKARTCLFVRAQNIKLMYVTCGWAMSMNGPLFKAFSLCNLRGFE